MNGERLAAFRLECHQPLFHIDCAHRCGRGDGFAFSDGRWRGGWCLLGGLRFLCFISLVLVHTHAGAAHGRQQAHHAQNGHNALFHDFVLLGGA